MSRKALLSGRYPTRISTGNFNLPAKEVTIAELLRTRGYQTACIGKWDQSGRKEILPQMPNAQGFDYYFGTLGANDNGTVVLHENNTKLRTTGNMGSLTKLYTDKAIDYVKRRDSERPFFLLLSHTMLHMVIDASPEFRGRSAGGLYGDVLEELDHETGRLLDLLNSLGIKEDTLVIFSTDNGPWNQPRYYQKALAHKRMKTFFEARPVYDTPEQRKVWGDAGPFRGGKGSAYEAGSRVPCIIRWPGKVPAGRTSDALAATIDFLPTFAALAGADLPTDRAYDGIDQQRLFLGKTDIGRETYIDTQAFSNKPVGIRRGSWKLLAAGRHPHPGKDHWFLMDFGTNEIELYDLATDPSESKNLADEHPKFVKKLMAEMETFAVESAQ